MRVGFLAKRLPLDFQLHDAALDQVDFGRQRINLHTQSGRGFVHQVDGLVRKEAVGDVALRQHGRGHNRGVLDAHAVVHFVALLQAAQNRDRVLDGRLADLDGLETALKRSVLLDVFAVLVERSRADGSQLAPRKRRLQHVGSVHRAFGRSRTDERVQLVNEQYDLPFGLGDFFQHRFEPVLELAAVLRARYQRREIERHDALGLEDFRHVAGDDPLGETLDDGRLAHSRLADQNWIVFRAPRENLHHAPNLFITADDGIELAAARRVREVARVLFDRAIGGFGILGRNAMAAANRGHCLQDGIVARAMARKDLGRRVAVRAGNGEQDMFG